MTRANKKKARLCRSGLIAVELIIQDAPRPTRTTFRRPTAKTPLKLTKSPRKTRPQGRRRLTFKRLILSSARRPTIYRSASKKN